MEQLTLDVTTEFDPAERIDYEALKNVEDVDYDDQVDEPIDTDALFDVPIE